MKDDVSLQFLRSGATLTAWSDKQVWCYRMVCACGEPIQIDIEDEFGADLDRRFKGLNCIFTHRGKWWKAIYGADLDVRHIIYGCIQVMQRSEFGCNFPWEKEVHDWLCSIQMRYPNE